MALYFHRKSLIRAMNSLTSQINTFRDFTEQPQYPTDTTERIEFCLRNMAAIDNAVALISASQNELLLILEAIRKEYVETKKNDKKEFLEEFQALEQEVAFNETLAESHAILTALRTRLAEVKFEHSKLEPQHALSTSQTKNNIFPNIESGESTSDNFNDIPNSLPQQSTLREQEASTRTQDNESANTLQTRMTIQPPRVTVPPFAGDAENFQEYWAVFDSLVHSNTTLTTMEKMILLKESLKGRAANTIRGIKMIPQNYMWMVNTLKGKYENLTNARANIIKRLVSLHPAKQDSVSCNEVFDEIRCLVNEMTSSGYNISDTQDPMWIETILRKFPRLVVEEFLRENRDGESYTITETLHKLEEVILREAFISERLNNTQTKPQTLSTPHSKRDDDQQIRRYSCNFCGRTNHRSYQCREVKEPSARRKVAIDKNLCWKCFARDHTSNQCSRPHCKRCGRLHDESLCLLKQTTADSVNTHMGDHHTAQSPSQTSSRGEKNNTKFNIRSTKKTPDPNTPTMLNITSASLQSETPPWNLPNHYSLEQQVVLMTAEGLVWNCASRIYQRALFFFDTGAQVSLVNESSARSLALPITTTETCTLSGIGGAYETFLSNHVILRVQTAQGREIDITMKTKPTITTGFSSVRLTKMDIEYLEENNIFLTNTYLKGEHQIPHILIGIDLYSQFVNEFVPPIVLPSGLRVAQTIFGLAAYGRGWTGRHALMPNNLTCNAVLSESQMIKNIYELESLGISTKEGNSDEETYAYLRMYSKAICFGDNSVTAPFPLKENICDLKDNYNIALRRLIAQVKHLNRFPKRKEWYVKLINQYLQDDIIEEVMKPVPNSVGTYYMPHSDVWREHKQTPLRIVFDASSHQKGSLSLNEVIYTGHSFVNKIHEILIASRDKPIILIADIQAAFTQIRVQESHRDLCRFLWLRNPQAPPIQSNLITYRWKRVPFGVTSSPSMLNMVLSAYLQKLGTPLATEILKKLYVDNVLLGADSEEEAIQKYKEAKELFSSIGMNLRSFVSNSMHVNSKISEHDRAPYGAMKLLGVDYNPITDTFSLQTDFSFKPIEKRDYLKQHHSLYDPIGWAAPLIINQKRLLRKLFEEKIDWKSQMNPEFAREWCNLSKTLNNFQVQVPRAMFKNIPVTKINLWIFADASNQAMAVCAYAENSYSRELSSLISGKTKLAPKKRKLTTPQLELLAILLALRLAESIKHAISERIVQVNIVSDSLIALHWIRSTRKISLFAANQRDRIKVLINKLTTLGCSCNLFHITGEKNPADVGTRGITSAQFENHAWILGPQQVVKEKEKLLTNIDTIDKWESSEEENEQEETPVLTQLHLEVSNHEDSFIDLSRFSRFAKALRVTAYVCMFVKILKDLRRSESINAISAARRQLTSVDIDEAETLLLKLQHRNIDLDDLHKRHKDKQIFRDDKGIIRCASRMQNANLSYDTRNPIYIPPKSDIMRLILREIHLNHAHCGKNHLLSIARQRFWLSKPSKPARDVLKSCAICQRQQSLPFKTPEMAPLPADRVVKSKPFQNVGCDFMGPFALKDNAKAYVCLYTCLTIRAVHLEVVENLSTQAFLNSFIRFTARRGVPLIVRTDCGTNFILGQKVIDALYASDSNQDNSVMSYCAARKITWLFNPPDAPWMGGVWERLVKSVKIAFQKSIGRKKLTIIEMTTALTQIEAILNTRPLSAISTTDICAIPLRPIDFLQGNLKFSLPMSTSLDMENDDLDYNPEYIQTVNQVKEALQFSESIANKFWTNWNIEYLSLLRDLQKSSMRAHRHNARTTPELGEIVLIEHELLPRGHWTCGKIVELIRSTDGLIRTVKLKLPFRNNLLQRPISKLYPLEIRATAEEETQQSDVQHDNESKGNQSVRMTTSTQNKSRKPRAAKTKAIQALRDQQRNDANTELCDDSTQQGSISTDITDNITY